jgi:glycosyltransferase involved in cell wall biosynthesis
MTSRPYFSVVLSTYGRGEHIRPTVESVLRQTYFDFELIAVGDGCADETAEVVESFKPREVSWYNLEKNTGSQSFPNNLGIAKATGNWIAYIGHDDIWSPHHLERLRALIEADSELDFAVSGCVYYGPKDSGIYYVTGMFDGEGAPFEHFFPPSSLAHRREIVELIGGWRDPRAVAAPVDCDFLLRAVHAGLRFSSTNEITVHKFAAGHRYLSYLSPEAKEQWAALNDPQIKNHDSLSAVIEKCQQQGHYMIMRYPDFSQFENGELFDQNRSNKGILRPVLKELDGRVVMEQTGEPRALDWYALENGDRPSRWSGPNPWPKILIPYACQREVQITLCISPTVLAPLRNIRIGINGHPVDYEIHGRNRIPTVVIRTTLQEADYSILTLHTPEMVCPNDRLGNGDLRRLGIAVSDVVIEPLTLRRLYRSLGASASRLLRKRLRLNLR